MSRLLERDRELAELDAAIAHVRSGSGRLVVVEAHAGLGKTQLLQAARDAAARADLRVLSARATELERHFPFSLVRQLFEAPLKGMPPHDRRALFDGPGGAARSALGLPQPDADNAGTADAFAILNGLYWMTAALAERTPLLLAIDDLHWGDSASLDFLGFLLPRLDELPVLLVVTCRPDQAGASDGVARVATDAVATRLTPSPLSADAAATLLSTEFGAPPMAALAAACHDVSSGNPFFLRELARTLRMRTPAPGAEAVEAVRKLAPERVSRTIALRISRLTPDARAVANAVAVLGDDSDQRVVAELAGLPPGAASSGADELRAAAVLDDDPALRFIHPLVRTVLHANLPAGARAAAHAHAAALLRSRDAGPEQVAAHLLAGEPQGRTEDVETLLEAGRRALASGAPRSAIAFLTRALREPPSPELRAAVLSPLVTASVRAADHASYATIEPEILAELERSPALRSRWAPKVALWMTLNGRTEQAIALLEGGIEVAVRDDDLARAFRLEAQLGMIAQLPPAVMQERLARYADRIVASSATDQFASALNGLWSVFTADAATAAGHARQALAGGSIFALRPDTLTPVNVVVVLVLADQLERAGQVAAEALAVAHERTATPELIGACLLSGIVALARGDLAAAEADSRQGLSVARAARLLPAQPVLTAMLAFILVERGELEAAAAELDGSGMTGDVPDVMWLAPILFARGLTRLAQGRFAEAAADLLELSARRERWGLRGSPALPAGLGAARALAALGEHEQARAVAEAELVHARRWGAPTATANALRTLGLTIGGSAGLALLEEAVEMLDGSPALLARAHALGELGATLRRSNRRAQAREPLREALELARRCGATGLAKQVRDELQASGETVRRYTPIGVESLTPSERRVAELAAGELTNRQIAQTLFLTVKTIESHLAAAYDKLGIQSRRQLADALDPRPGLTRPAA